MNSLPMIVRVMRAWGVELESVQETEEWGGECPFCEKPGQKFFANARRLAWHCKRCGLAGDISGFLTEVHRRALARTTDEDYVRLAAHRSLPRYLFKKAGIAWHRETQRWAVPGWDWRGVVRDLRRYDPDGEPGQRMKSTPSCHPQMLGARSLSGLHANARVWVCEGEWDGLALDWALTKAGITRDQAVAVAVPGAGIFAQEWVPLLARHRVAVAYDHDPAGARGAAHVLDMLRSVARSIEFVRWPDDAAASYDVRDLITDRRRDGASFEEVVHELGAMLSPKLPPIPGEEGRAAGPAQGHDSLDTSPPRDLKPISFSELMDAFGRVMRMTPDLRAAIWVSAAVVASAKFHGDPLFMYLVGPAGSGKTLVLDAFGEVGYRCTQRSTFTEHTLVSGFQAKNDPSLAPKLVDRTLVIKDFTMVLSLNIDTKQRVFSQFRDLYDGSHIMTYGNGITREYVGSYFNVLAAVTNEIHSTNLSALGERFLKFNLEGMSDDDEAEVIKSAAVRTRSHANGVRDEGVVAGEGLKDAAARFFAREMEDLPSLGRFLDPTVALARVTAALRASVKRSFNGKMEYPPVKEIGTRLVKQLTKLAGALAWVVERKAVDAEVYALVLRVAMDTAYGWQTQVFRYLLARPDAWVPSSVLQGAFAMSGSHVMDVLQDMAHLEIVEIDHHRNNRAMKPSKSYRLSPKYAALWAAASEPLRPPIVPPKSRLTLRRKHA